MRQIVKTPRPTSEITIEQLKKESIDCCRLIVAYRSYNSDAYCVLANLHTGNHAGFIPLNGVSNVRFVANNCYDAIELASKSRKVFIFSSMDEMLKAMVNKEF